MGPPAGLPLADPSEPRTACHEGSSPCNTGDEPTEHPPEAWVAPFRAIARLPGGGSLPSGIGEAPFELEMEGVTEDGTKVSRCGTLTSCCAKTPTASERPPAAPAPQDPCWPGEESDLVSELSSWSLGPPGSSCNGSPPGGPLRCATRWCPVDAGCGRGVGLNREENGEVPVSCPNVDVAADAPAAAVASGCGE